MTNWPTPQEYNEAIQTPQLCFSDPDLRKTKIALNSLGLPKSASGAFASVYKATNGSTSWAVRCFLSNRPEQSERYQHISDFVLFDNLDSTVDFHYLTEGVQVKGQWYPCLKMVWVEGPTLDQYIESNFKDSVKMTDLLKSFHQMVGELEGAGIGHGDLQHGNIIVTEKGLRLVDYDALFVPALAGLKSLEFGHPNYQHPQRTENHYDPDVDNFSCWLIHASLLAIAIDPSLYRSLGGGDEALIFKRKDLLDPEDSPAFATLLSHDSEHIRETALLIKRMLWAAPDSIPYLGAPAEILDKLPRQRTEKIITPTTDPETDSSEIQANESANQSNSDTNWMDEVLNDQSKLTDSISDFSSGYDAIAASSSERSIQKRKPATKLRQLTQGTFRAGLEARNRIQKLAEKLEQSAMPANWINRKYTEAYDLYDNAEYEKASKIFLAIFKQLDEQRSGKTYFEIALVLGCALSLAGNPAVAGNYFVVAYNYARRQTGEFLLPRAGLALALSKYEESDVTAWKFLDDNPRALAYLSDVIYNDMTNPYFRRTVTFRMLRDYAVRMIEHQHFHNDAFSDAFSDAVESSWIVLGQIMRNDPHFNDESLIESFISLVGRLQLVGKQERANNLLFSLADACDSSGFPNHAKTARFCGATLLYSDAAHQNAALKILSGLGNMSIDDLTTLATTSSAFLSQNAILQLLVNVSKTFEELGSKAEAKDALRVACRVGVSCEQASIDLIVSAFDLFDPDTISECLKESYMHPGCNAKLTAEFVELVGKSSHMRVQSAIVMDYVKRGQTQLLGEFLVTLAKHTDARSLGPLIAGGDQAAQATVMGAADIAVEKLLKQLEGCKSPIPPGDFASFPWQRFTPIVTAIDNFRTLFKMVKEDKRAEQLLLLIASEEYSEIINHWFIQMVAASNYDRYYSLAQDLADHHEIEVLERLISDLVRYGHLIVVDGITKNLTVKNHLLLLIELSENLARKGNLDAFAQISKEVAKTAQIGELLATIDKLIESDHEQTEFVVTLLKRMLEQHQANKASTILKHLYQIDKISLASGLASTLLDSSFHGSLFDELLRQEDLETFGAIAACLAAEIKTEGIAKLYAIQKEGGMSDFTFSKILTKCFAELMRQLDRMLPQTDTLAKPLELLTNDERRVVQELNMAMQSLHYLRRFIVRKKDAGVQHIFVGMTETVSESLDEKYDSLIALWCLHLGRVKRQDLLNAAIDELITFNVDAAIEDVVEILIENSLFDALYGMSSYLVKAGQTQSALQVALWIAREHTLEAKAITTEILRSTASETSLVNLIVQCVGINEKLVDMIVRQVATGELPEKLKSVALKLAQAGEERALGMVLTQIAATDDNFTAFVSLLCESIPNEHIAMIGNWLAENGMISAMRRQIAYWKDSGRDDKADCWAELLTDER